MKKTVFLFLFAICSLSVINAQGVGASPEYIKAITSEWKGERFPDGRPKISDELLERAKNVSIEALWGSLRNVRVEGQPGSSYSNQFQGEWHIVHPEQSMSGRAVTAQYMPSRPDLEAYVKEQGKLEKRAQQGGTNSWPIDILVDGDIYVADGYGKIVDGTLIGDNLANAIYRNSKRGVVFYGSVRDEEGISLVDGFNAWVLGVDPSYILGTMLTTINQPVRIGRATCLPGDLVVAKKYGVIFIPAHIAEQVLIAAEVTELRDRFGWQRLREGKYLPGQIDSRWSDEIRADFREWLNQYPKLPMPKAELDAYLNNNRSW
jgi:Demethylmenaquinone methyltransferase